MPYYIRILGTSAMDIVVDDLSDYLANAGMKATVAVEKGKSNEEWEELAISDKNGKLLFTVEKSMVTAGSQGSSELEEMRQELDHYKPVSATRWLNRFFDEVQVLYVIRMTPASLNERNYSVFKRIKDLIHEFAGGIIQSDNEGYTNEEGYHILWQFPEEITGRWDMAILDDSGEWVKFKMNLGNRIQRSEFFAGKVPERAIRL